MPRKTLAGFINRALAAIMLYAVCRKIFDYKMFRNEVIFSLANIDNSNLIYVSRFGEIFILLQCALELSAACLVLANNYRLAGLYLTFSALVTSSVYLLVVIQVNYNISMFFGSILPGASITLHLVFNFVVLVISLAGLYLNESQKQTSI